MAFSVVFILDNIRSVHNVGSIFRTANACGVNEIFLCGITPTPLDKKGRARSDFAKVSLGAEQTIKWEYFESTLELVKKLRDDGYFVIAIEQDEKAVDYKLLDVKNKKKIAFMVGSEVDGVSREVLNNVSAIAEISMVGSKESLNVTIALGVAVYRIMNI